MGCVPCIVLYVPYFPVTSPPYLDDPDDLGVGDEDGPDGDDVLDEHEQQRVEELVHGLRPPLSAHLVQHQVGLRQVEVVGAGIGR